MKELNIDISSQKSKPFDVVKDIEFDYIVSMGYEVKCPKIEGTEFIEWHIEDPDDKGLDFYRETREKIHNNLKEFLNRISLK